MTDEDDAPPPGPKWLLDASGNRDRAKRSNKAERRVASSLGGRRIARSGAKRWSSTDYKTTDRGDIRTATLHVEHKRTDRESMSVKKEWLEKVTKGAARVDKTPAIVITFEEPGRPPLDWIMVPLAVAVKKLGVEVPE